MIFTAIPVLSAALAITFLHEDPFDALGWVGAAMIVAAGLAIAASTQQEQSATAATQAAEEDSPGPSRGASETDAVSASVSRERRG